MKKIYIFLIAVLFAFSISSCSFETYATTQDDVYIEHVEDIVCSNVDASVVIRYGNPYYYNGSILYYLYNGIYYYPYCYNDYWYFRAYRRPFPHVNYHPYFRPHRYDYRFDRGYNRPHNWYRYAPSPQRNNNHYRPRPSITYPNGRPGQQNRPSYGRPSRPTTRPNGTFPNGDRESSISRPNTQQRPIGGSRGVPRGRR